MNSLLSFLKLKIYRSIDKASFILYLWLKRLILTQKRLKENQGSILILADLLFGDLAMAGYLIILLRQNNPNRKIVLLSKHNLADIAKLYDVDCVIGADYLNWSVFKALKMASPDGYGVVINIFSWKWLPMIQALPTGEIISHLARKHKANSTVTHPIAMPSQPLVAPRIILDLLGTADAGGAKLRLNRITQFLLPQNNYIVLHIGASSQARLWPIELLKFIFNLLLEKNFTIVLTGLKQTKDFENKISQLQNLYKDKVINYIGQTSILELIDLVNSSKGLISVDTGIVHWARLLSVPNLSVMGQSDINLFGSGSLIFTKSESITIKKLDCQDKNTFHSIKTNWMGTCSRNVCPLQSRLCFDHLNYNHIEKSFNNIFES